MITFKRTFPFIKIVILSWSTGHLLRPLVGERTNKCFTEISLADANLASSPSSYISWNRLQRDRPWPPMGNDGKSFFLLHILSKEILIRFVCMKPFRRKSWMWIGIIWCGMIVWDVERIDDLLGVRYYSNWNLCSWLMFKIWCTVIFIV